MKLQNCIEAFKMKEKIHFRLITSMSLLLERSANSAFLLIVQLMYDGKMVCKWKHPKCLNISCILVHKFEGFFMTESSSGVFCEFSFSISRKKIQTTFVNLEEKLPRLVKTSLYSAFIHFQIIHWSGKSDTCKWTWIW